MLGVYWEGNRLSREFELKILCLLGTKHYLPGYVWPICPPSVQYEGISLEICPGSGVLVRVALLGKEALWGLPLELYSNLQPYSPSLKDGHGREVIPETMLLIAERTGQEYNQRKDRKGAFWEDRYHATAVEAGFHLTQCLVYMDLNMVHTRAVAHPSAWPFSGYNEIQNFRERYSLIDYESLMDLLNIKSAGE